MALTQHDLLRLLESLRSADGLELVRSVAERMLQELIEAEASAKIGAEWNEHADTRTAYRSGHRERTLTSQAGDLDLAIPKLRSGSFFPSLLERRRRIDQALYAVIMEAYVHGVSTRSVDDLVKALGADTGISKSEVSRICGDLDVQLTAFRNRPLDHVRFPYMYLDATYCKARVEHQIVSRAVVIATGITEDGGREVLGVMVGDSETEVFWTQFLRSLRERGLDGVRLVIGDHQSGLVKAIRKVMLAAASQRCRVHFLRNVFGVISKESAEMVTATIRTIFAQPTDETVHQSQTVTNRQVVTAVPPLNSKTRYNAIYPADAIEAHRAFIARRRSLRPSEEYRTPTNEEWDAFLAHFEKRKLSLGTCARAFGTSCIHEHACVRCSLLRPEPSLRDRLIEIRDNLLDRIVEAQREGWLGEVEGLEISLAGAEEKLTQLDAALKPSVTHLGLPTFGQTAGRSNASGLP